MRALPRPARRGFSLVELMVALVVSSFAVAGALALMTGQQRLFQRSSGERSVQEAARVALENLSGNLRMAGFGLEPTFAFDFGAIANVPADRLPPGAVASVPGYACAAPVACRDGQAGGAGPDEIVFHYRNPAFVRPLNAAPGGASLTMSGPLAAPLRRGQLLQVACYAGSMYWAFVTVGADVPATNAASVNVALEGGNGNEFGHQNQVLADPCFTSVAPPGATASSAAATAAAKVFKVERFRYFIQSYAANGAVVAWGTAGSRPYLMLDRGLSIDGNAITEVVAADVEDLQLSYVFPRAAAGTQQAGATPGLPLANDAAGIQLGAATPTYSARLTAAARLTHHPANIGAVRVAVVVRTPEADTTLHGPTEALVPASVNRADAAGPAGYRRFRYETTVGTPNLDVRAPYFPTYATNPAVDRLNVDGG